VEPVSSIPRVMTVLNRREEKGLPFSVRQAFFSPLSSAAAPALICFGPGPPAAESSDPRKNFY